MSETKAVDLSTIAEEFRKEIPVKDHRVLFKTIPSSFVGSEAVDWLMQKEQLKTREEAVTLGKQLMYEGIFRHISNDYSFEDRKLFYSLNNPEEVAQQKTEFAMFVKDGYMQLKGLFGWRTYWFQLKGNLLSYSEYSGGREKGKVNVLGCQIIGCESNPREFKIKGKKKAINLRAENEDELNKWIDVICRVKDRTLKERKELLSEWEKEDECVSCIAAMASLQAQEEEEAEAEKTMQQLEEDNEEKREKELNEDGEQVLQELFQNPIENVKGEPKVLLDVFQQDVIVLTLLRHFGCMFCRKSASVVASVKPALDSMNIGLVAIGSGTALMATSFQRDFQFPGDLFVDTKRMIYKALGCNRGLKYAISKKTIKAIKTAMSEGFQQGKIGGDTLQLGGVFVISRTKGILFQHLEEYAGHDVNLDELLEACKQIPQ